MNQSPHHKVLISMKRGLLVLALVLPATGYAQTQPGAITGRILREDGTPAVRVRVAAAPVPRSAVPPEDFDDLARLVETDANGFYRLDDLPAGQYYLVAGSIYFPTYYPGVLRTRDARTVSVQNTTVAGINFALTVSVGVSVRGRLIHRAGPGQFDYADRKMWIGRGNARLQETPLNPDDSFEFRDIPPGRYSVGTIGYPPVEITVPEKGLLNVDIPIPLMVQLLGRLTVEGGSPVPSITATFKGDPGTFSISSGLGFGIRLPEGDYEFVPSLPPGYLLKSLTLNDVAISSNRLQLRASEQDGQLIINLGFAQPAR
jgi:hypothetical protein